MRMSQYCFRTFRSMPIGTETLSYQLMLRAGLIRKVASGLYAWLPTGLRVLRKVENIIREEMSKIGAMEVCLPIVQPANLWKRSGRWTQYGPELLRFKNRSNQEFILSPTHEELVAQIISKEIVSYKQLPLILYQIQNKFRDEIRPRFGVLRSREFIMKDGYSFHISDESLQNTYEIIYESYNIIFNKFKLNFRIIRADSGNIGGNFSHEFHAIVDNGEDVIACSTISDYAASLDLENIVSSCISMESNIGIEENMRLIKMFSKEEVIDVIEQYKIPREKFVRTFIVRADKKFGFSFLGLLIRSDHKLSYTKIEKLPQVSLPLTFANEDEIYSLISANSSVLGPVNLHIPLVADHDVSLMKNFIVGANIDNGYFFGVNWGRDLPLPTIADLRKIVSGDYSRNSNSILNVKRSVEIGHIFQLGNKYLDSFSSKVQGKNKKNINLVMGCYGIGISRVIASVIEQNNDKNGIMWPDVLAPFFVVIVPVDMHRSHYVAELSEKLYNEFSILKIDVLLDDRNESLGVKFSDMELIGIPHSIIISDKSLNTEEVEYKYRRSNKREKIKINKVVDFFLKIIVH